MIYIDDIYIDACLSLSLLVRGECVCGGISIRIRIHVYRYIYTHRKLPASAMVSVFWPCSRLLRGTSADVVFA